VGALAAGSLVVAGGIALTPSASGAPSLQPRAYTYGNWAQPGSGFMTGPDDTMSQVYQLTWRGAFPDLDDTPGPVYAAGTFIKSGSTTINRVAQYDDTAGAWETLPGDDTGIAPTVGQSVPTGLGYTTPGVYGMVLGGDNYLYAGGQFVASDTTLNNVAQWNGNDWEPMGNGLRVTTDGNVVQDMVIGNDFIGGDDLNYGDDTVYALGGFVGTCATLACSSTGRTAAGVAQYSQADDTWYPVGTGAMSTAFGGVVPQAYSGAYIDDTLYIGGSFNGVGGVTVANIAQWSAASGAWRPVGQGIQANSQWDGVFSMAVHPVTKDLYVGGQFAQPVGGSTSMGGIVKWDYTDDTWYAVGTGLTGGNTDDIAFSADGETMYIGSWDTAPNIGGTLANGIAILESTDFDDTAATTINGTWGYVKSAGAIGVTGPSSTSLNQKSVRAVLAYPGDSVVAGGNFKTAGAVNAGRVAVFTPGPEPDPNVPATPPGAPTNVVAKGGWQTVTVSWDAPKDQGTYPITNYLAQATAVGSAPSGNVCITRLTDAKLTECTFTSLKPGVQYTFKVQGLNGGGWGARSEASNVATPYELKITGYGRKKLSFLKIPLGSEVSAKGTAFGYPAGTRIKVFIKEGDSGQWVEQKNSGLTTNAAGTFSWQRKFSKGKDGTPISVQFGIANDRSNSVRIPPVK